MPRDPAHSIGYAYRGAGGFRLPRFGPNWSENLPALRIDAMRWLVRVFPLAACLAFFTPGHADEAKKPATGPVSFAKQIRPIFQANCQGCHQPAKARGDYVMTAFDKLLAGGESGEAAIVAKHPEQSKLIADITPVDGKAKMPPEGKKPLDETDIELIRRWIAEGAVDDTPANAAAASTPTTRRSTRGRR